MNKAFAAPALLVVAKPEVAIAFCGAVHAEAGSKAAGGVPCLIGKTDDPCIGPVTRTSCNPVCGSMYFVACPVSIPLVIDRSMLGIAALYGAAKSTGTVSPATSPSGGLTVL